MIRYVTVLSALLALCAANSDAQEVVYALTPAAPPPLRIPNTLRIAGTPALADLLVRWRAEYAGLHPELQFEVQLRGTDVGMAALYTGSADLVLAGRESTAAEDKAFEWIYRYRPAHVEIATGSLDQAGRSPAPVLFVHGDNPLRHLTMAQVRAILLPSGHDGTAAIRRWGDLGLTGDWLDAAIHIYSFDMESGTGRFLRQRLLGDSRKLEWSIITEFPAAVAGPDHTVARRILRALEGDRHGLALAHYLPGYRGQPLAIAAGDVQEPVLASSANLISRAYPLARPVYAYFNQPPRSTPAPEVAAFLDFVRSQAGQAMVAGDGGYLPLPGLPFKP